MKEIPLALTYDDVLIKPKFSTVASRRKVDTSTKLTKSISLNIPIVSSNMDTVTESTMATALARLGGIGIIHRFLTIEENVEEIKRVKRAQNLIIEKPYSVLPSHTIAAVKEFGDFHDVSGLLVVDEKNKLRGIISKRDMFFSKEPDQKAEEVMTPFERLIVAEPNTTLEEAKEVFRKEKIEKLPLVDENQEVAGLITLTDLEHIEEYPLSNTDENGQLIVGGSIGVTGDYLERGQALVDAGVDVLVIDIAHGHSKLMLNALEKAKERFGNSVDIIAGNVATAEGARDLCKAGADAVKVGVGPGTICITRVVTGCGVPQLTAVMEASREAEKHGVPVIADGGIQKSGDIVKALGAGADSVMLGGMMAGTKESPGVVMNRGGKKYKVCRGSASFAVAQRRKRVGQEKNDLQEVTPEGVESVVRYKGPLKDTIGQLIGGLRSGMSYANAHEVSELKENVEFMRITNAGRKESGAHDVKDVK